MSYSAARPKVVDSLRAVFAFCILANLPFWAAHFFFETGARAYINVDYLLVGIAALYVPWAWTLVMLSTVFVFDFFRTSAASYYFSQHDLLVAIASVRHVPLSRTLGIGLALIVSVIAFAILTAAVGKTSRSRKFVSMVLICVLMTLVVLRIRHDRNGDLVEGPSVANSNSLSLVRAAYASTKQTPKSDRYSVKAATDLLMNGQNPGLAVASRRNLVVVLAEAYGEFKDPVWSQFLLKPFDQPSINARYNVEQGVVPFQGGTVSGELRELCHVRSEIPATGDDLTWMNDCLPQHWNATRETTAIHGFTGYMFDRRTWYPRMGFQNILFLPELEREGVRRCDIAFDGACDDQIADLIHRKLTTAKRPQVIYWVTIDTHLPVTITRSAPLFCGTDHSGYDADNSVCEWMNGTYNNNASLAQIAADPDLPPTEFLIVGDHAPPFISNSRRQLFATGVVAYIHLIPR